MIIADMPSYRTATLEQLMAYADTFGISYASELTGDVPADSMMVSDKIRAYMLDYQRIRDISEEIFLPDRILSIGQLQMLLSYDQVADGLMPKISTPDVKDRNFDDAFNYYTQSTIGNYIMSAISTFNVAMSSVSGLYWTSDDQQYVIPCTAQYFKYHEWGTAYDNETSGAFFYPSGTADYPEGWDGLGLGINRAPAKDADINYLRRLVPSTYWRISDVQSTNWPDVTESNQSCRSAMNSLIIHYEPCSGI